MTNKALLTRRVLIGAGAAAATGAAPALANALEPTPIARLWAETMTLSSKLAAHRGQIAEAALRAGDTTPGWMRLTGEANRLAEARYGKLVDILNATPASKGDLTILAKVTQDADILAGARNWAHERLAAGTLALAA